LFDRKSIRWIALWEEKVRISISIKAAFNEALFDAAVLVALGKARQFFYF
jgi:hypothetical protein